MSEIKVSVEFHKKFYSKINLVCRANGLLLVKCYNNKKVLSPYNWVISPLTQPEVANQQQKKDHRCWSKRCSPFEGQHKKQFLRTFGSFLGPSKGLPLFEFFCILTT